MKRSPNLAMFVGWALRNFPQNFYVVESAHLTVIENGARFQFNFLYIPLETTSNTM
ncbi:hypothetical protein ACF3DV_06585 [Chlorogloeopsis fritschii PCC 9212]|uniref:hypothetical protein n=1 Tax=Chlorogloeopsis fritschii TaxID=1124 RepID=UPI0002FF001A|nr:hypothetical protein [Chlorogloeopsis fritschii]MBF2004407.1 hypothetical protein [Chlorogloeopsis fritschii C42_A2020_084]